MTDTPIYDGMTRDPRWGDPADISHQIKLVTCPAYRAWKRIQGILNKLTELIPGLLF